MTDTEQHQLIATCKTCGGKPSTRRGIFKRCGPPFRDLYAVDCDDPIHDLADKLASASAIDMHAVERMLRGMFHDPAKCSHELEGHDGPCPTEQTFIRAKRWLDAMKAANNSQPSTGSSTLVVRLSPHSRRVEATYLDRVAMAICAAMHPKPDQMGCIGKEAIVEILWTHLGGVGVDKALDAERERCAAICDELAKRNPSDNPMVRSMAMTCAEMIRVRER